ncbi:MULTISPECIES: peptidase inhibitor family I36 protein [unclassified Nonomuraea]|uniref:peptidase inhibitor family I36 protein n=1 Tax=unclassified Nonomuraea TaxID=2593643 RepID=UPI0013767F8F|nr:MULTISPECIES: peptidase inhibitor family I36 protein [unclassified Nonomuraea]NBE96894.1 hypothetical protein [Nonomuraea sp. K271]
MKKVLVGSLLAAVAVVGAPGVAAVQADSRSSAARYLYLYEHDNFKGGWQRFSKNDANLATNTWRGTYRSVLNGASSMKNTSGSKVTLYSGGGYSGSSYSARPYSSDADLTKNSGNPSFDNTAESFKFG